MFRFGVDYYPEHWPEDRWEIDAQLMQEAGFNTVRLAEFAWSRLEPQAGTFDFDWLDRAIAILQAHGMQVVLGTPTASPPPWVMAVYPDAYRVPESGSPHHLRQPARLLPHPSRLPRAQPDRHGGHGRALRGPPGRDRLADRQRVRRPLLLPHCRAAFQTGCSASTATWTRSTPPGARSSGATSTPSGPRFPPRWPRLRRCPPACPLSSAMVRTTPAWRSTTIASCPIPMSRSSASRWTSCAAPVRSTSSRTTSWAFTTTS